MSTSLSTPQHSEKISILRLTASLSIFIAVSFVLCVVAGYLVPSLRGLMPITAIPGFSWEHPLSAVHGIIWSIGFGAYVGVLFGALYNFFAGLG